MIVINNQADLNRWQRDNKEITNHSFISLIPTMGALHSGHLSLIKQAQVDQTFTIVSIFVNPLQFGQNEDFNKYPKTLEKDLELCEKEKVDLLFLPPVNMVYPYGLNNLTMVKPRLEMSNCLCGISRPNHFEGVLTVVLKLFNLLRPNIAYFGLKDYQQFLLIKTMVEDLNFNIQIKGSKIVRDESGLALSSRNQYLTDRDKIEASNLYKALRETENLIKNGENIESAIKLATIKYLNNFILDYFEIRNENDLTFINLPKEVSQARLFIAAKLNGTRLIDNIKIKNS